MEKKEWLHYPQWIEANKDKEESSGKPSNQIHFAAFLHFVCDLSKTFLLFVNLTDLYSTHIYLYYIINYYYKHEKCIERKIDEKVQKFG